MSRSTRFVQGVGLGILRQVMVLAVGLAVTPLLLARLGQSHLGLWYVAGTLLAYLGVAELGVVSLLPREVGFALGRAGGDLGEVRATTTNVLGIALAQLPLLAVGVVILVLLAPRGSDALRAPLVFAASLYVLLYPGRIAQATLAGLQDLAFLEVAGAVSWALGTALSVALVLNGAGLLSVAGGWALTQGTMTVACAVRLRRRFPAAWPGTPRAPRWTEVRQWLGRSTWVTLSQVAMMLRNGTDLVVIGKVLGAASAVPYLSTAKLVLVLGVFPPMVLASAQPALAELRFGGDRQRCVRVTEALMSLALVFSGATACAALAMTEPFVTAWLGPEQFAGPALTAIFVANMVLRHASLSVTNTLFCLGYERSLAVVAVADGVLTVAVMWLLAPVLGLHGVAVGPLVGLVLVSLPYGLRTLARESGQSTFAYLRPFASWAVVFAGAAAATLAAVRWLELRSFTGAIVAGALATSGYALLTHRRLLEPPLWDYVRPALQRAARWIGIQGAPARGEDE